MMNPTYRFIPRHLSPAAPPTRALPKLLPTLLLALFFMMGGFSEAFSQTQEIFWRSEASNGNWFEDNPCGEIGTADSQWFYPHFGGNSSRNAPDCFGTYDLVFDNNHEPTMNNSTAFFNLNRITFTNNATSSRTIDGEGIDITVVDDNTPIIRNNSSATHTFNIAVALQSSPVEFNPVNGDLVFNSSIFTNGNFIDVFGTNGHTLTLAGVMQGAGGIALKQDSIVEIAGAMTYTGGTAVEAGIFRIVQGGNLVGDSVNFTDVTIAGSGTFDLNDQSVTVRSISELGQEDGGTIDLGSGTLTIDGGYATKRFQNSISGTGGSLVKNGTGELSLYGTQSYTGNTTINGGVIETSVGMSSSNIIINSGSTFRVISGAQTNSITVNDGATLEIAEGTVLTVAADETLTLEQGGTITMNGDLIVNGTLDIKDGAVLTVPSSRSLITNNVQYNTSGQIRFERLITAPTFNTDGEGHWIALGSPAAGNYGGNAVGDGGSEGLLDKLWTQGFPGATDPRTNVESNVLLYNEGQDLPLNERFVRPSSAEMTAGEGFFVFLYQYDNGRPGANEPETLNPVDFDNPFDITGEENQFDTSNAFDFSVSCSNGCGTNDGWNLLANPFGASLNWADDGWTKTSIDDFAYLWDPATSQYFATASGGPGEDNIEGILGTPSIAPFQAFFVKASASGPTLTVPAAARSTNADNAGLFNENPSPVFTLKLEAGESESFTGFRFAENYTESFSASDAYFLSPMASSFAYTYSLKQNRATMLNSLPLDLQEPVEFSVAAGAFVDYQYYSGEASFSWPTFENIPADWIITLTDTQTGEVIDLKEEQSYSFQMSATGMKQELGEVKSFRDLQEDSSPVMNTKFAGDRFILSIDPDGTTTSTPVDGELPTEITLQQNYPNPFTPATQMSYALPESSEVRLEVFNVQGQHVATLIDGRQNAGTHSISFDAGNLSSGVYLYRLRAGNQVITRKMTLLK